jgi:hypothetical protein
MGWGKDMPAMLRNDDWNYSLLPHAKQHRPEPTKHSASPATSRWTKRVACSRWLSLLQRQKENSAALKNCDGVAVDRFKWLEHQANVMDFRHAACESMTHVAGIICRSKVSLLKVWSYGF